MTCHLNHGQIMATPFMTKEFTGDTTDNELQFLYNYLLTLKAVDNVRTIEKRGWRQ